MGRSSGGGGLGRATSTSSVTAEDRQTDTPIVSMSRMASVASDVSKSRIAPRSQTRCDGQKDASGRGSRLELLISGIYNLNHLCVARPRHPAEEWRMLRNTTNHVADADRQKVGANRSCAESCRLTSARDRNPWLALGCPPAWGEARDRNPWPETKAARLCPDCSSFRRSRADFGAAAGHVRRIRIPSIVQAHTAPSPAAGCPELRGD